MQWEYTRGVRIHTESGEIYEVGILYENGI